MSTGDKLESGGKGAIQGAAIGSTILPGWGTLAGGVLGFGAGLLTGGDGAKAYQPDWNNYRSPTDTGVAGSGSKWGVGKYWSDKAREYDASPQRRAIGSARDRQIAAMNNMYSRATTGSSVAMARAAQQAQALRAGAHGASRGAVGMGNRRAMLFGARGGASVANSAMMAEQAERLKAMGRFTAGAGKFFGSETDWFGRQAADQKARSGRYMSFIGQGLADKQAEISARLRYEKAKMAAYNRTQKADQADKDSRNRLIGGVVSAGGKAIASQA